MPLFVAGFPDKLSQSTHRSGRSTDKASALRVVVKLNAPQRVSSHSGQGGVGRVGVMFKIQWISLGVLVHAAVIYCFHFSCTSNARRCLGACEYVLYSLPLSISSARSD